MNEKLGIDYRTVLADARDFNGIQERIVNNLAELKRNHPRIGFVSGALGGDETMQESMDKLSNYASKLQEEHRFPMVCSTGIFFEELWKKLQEPNLPEDERSGKFKNLFRKILQSGHITDIFMTPGWQNSDGAKDEYETARKIGITIHKIPVDIELKTI